MLPLGSVGFERDPDAKGELQIWLDGPSSTGSQPYAVPARAFLT